MLYLKGLEIIGGSCRQCWTFRFGPRSEVGWEYWGERNLEMERGVVGPERGQDTEMRGKG